MIHPRQIVKLIGSFMDTAVLCGVTEGAVKRWVYIAESIPEEYWSKILKHPACRDSLTAEKLHAMNERSRRRRAV